MQLKMVEEIVARYREAKPVRRRRWPWVLLVLLLLVAGNNLSHRLDEIKQQYNGLQYAVHDVTDQIDSISNRVETILKAQNSLAADYGSEIAASNLAAIFRLRRAPDLCGGAVRGVYRGKRDRDQQHGRQSGGEH